MHKYIIIVFNYTIISIYTEAILIGVSIALAGLVITVLVAVIIGVLCVSSRAQKSMIV